MIKQQSTSHILPPLQSDILLHLAEEGSQTINEIASGVSRSYKPTWTAFNSLKQKKLVKEASVKNYRGREYPRFWLTDDGALVALAEGTDFDRLFELTKQIYPKNKILACYLEVVSKMNLLDTIRVGYSALKRKGELDPLDLMNMILTGTKKKTTDQQLQEIVDVIKTYPKEYVSFKKRLDQILESLDKLKEIT